MILVDCAQGSDDWFEAKRGIPSASCFDKILTPKKLEQGRNDYMMWLLADWASTEPTWGDDDKSIEMIRGTAAEKSARRWYEFQRDVEVEQVGFCLTDDRRAGCSPDGLVGDDGGLEIKCPMGKQVIGYLLAEDPSLFHRGQIQGSMWVTGRAWWDLVVWHPFFPKRIYRAYPDAEWVEKFEPALVAFHERMNEGKERLRKLGVAH